MGAVLQRHFFQPPAELQKAAEEMQKALEEAQNKAKLELDRATKVVGGSLEMGADQGRQALEKAHEALEKAKEEIEKVLPPGAIQGRQEISQVIGQSLAAGAEQGMQVVNAALAATGSSQRFGEACPRRAPEPAGPSGKGERPPPGTSLFWDPDNKESPFKMGREKFIEKSLEVEARCKGAGSICLVPDVDVENYVDFLISSAVLKNQALPQAMGRALYIRVVRMGLRAILNLTSLAEGEFLGKHLRFLQGPCPIANFRYSTSTSLDANLLDYLAKRVLKDEINHLGHPPPFLEELGLPEHMLEHLYQDVITLSVRLALDLALTFQVRCLGHSVTLTVTPDAELHLAPGWEASLEQGVFGLIDFSEKERWAEAFVDRLLQDTAVKLKALPEDVQRHVFKHVALVQLNIVEKALNFFRIHVGGMAFRPALLPGAHAPSPPPQDAAAAPAAAASA